MILDVIDNIVEKGVNILSKLASDWIDDLGKEVLGDNKTSNTISTPHAKVVDMPTVGTGVPVNQVNVNITVNGIRQGLIFVDDNGNDIVTIDGYRVVEIKKS